MGNPNGDGYAAFLRAKGKRSGSQGFKPRWLPDCLFPFQRVLAEWAVRAGRGAVLAACGLGKSLIELVWAENVVRKANRPVLLLTPLAVGPQMVAEGEKFGIPVHLAKDGSVRPGVNAVNYQRLHYFNPTDFAGVVCDEAGVLKHHDSRTRYQVTKFLAKVPYRLLATATPAPNEWAELGNAAEALGVMSQGQMLGTFFTNGGEQTQHWELKGWARRPFWRWVSSWARACRKPSDLGFPDGAFVLPPLKTQLHSVGGGAGNGRDFGLVPPRSLNGQRTLNRATLAARCEAVAGVVPEKDFAVVWCHLNQEGDLLERLIPGAVQVQGSDPDEVKEERLAAFSRGQIKTLVTKPKIGGWGLNWQHCNFMTYFPSHSYEAHYQAVRRCWRFGQARPVTVAVVAGASESLVLANMRRKELAMDEMFSALVREMGEYQAPAGPPHGDPRKVQVPPWLGGGR